MQCGHNIKVKRDGELSGCSRACMLNVRMLPSAGAYAYCRSSRERQQGRFSFNVRTSKSFRVNGVLTGRDVCTMQDIWTEWTLFLPPLFSLPICDFF